ncbi:MAG: enoyl-CoA hydratase/isomerase family protein [Gammaproteobacteria bacterium]|nr:enoyl-CoA hydratase/isomerase family protein [Gammaproteobacteria bacterium]
MDSGPILIANDDHGVTTVTLNRPAVRNALDQSIVTALHDAITRLRDDENTGILVLRGAGKSFCAGADLGWMRRMADFSEDQNYADAMRLAELLQALDQFPKPTLACVHGHSFGGGVGLVACCDIALASDTALFSLSEVKLGLIPGVISPFVVNAIGARAARRYFQSGERFYAAEALRIGLVHGVADPAELEGAVAACVAALLKGGPHAQAAAKQLIDAVRSAPLDQSLMDDTARRITRARLSEEGREGVAAFLEKRLPRWRRR